VFDECQYRYVVRQRATSPPAEKLYPGIAVRQGTTLVVPKTGKMRPALAAAENISLHLQDLMD
jgi:hypothetical protein